ncbi:NAD(P)-dependent oxidoreductase [Nonomuraea deserti]|uniref:NAD(P)-dependent oxidoreductase n=1 Tax=Nonomuraea deserti TaxID=1848322 RepID=UPI0034E0D4E3
MRPVSFDQLVEGADCLVIQAPLTPETHHTFDRTTLRRMKPTAILINTGRGPILEDAALHQALTEGWIAGAALDDLEEEPAKQRDWRPRNPLQAAQRDRRPPRRAGAAGTRDAQRPHRLRPSVRSPGRGSCRPVPIRMSAALPIRPEACGFCGSWESCGSAGRANRANRAGGPPRAFRRCAAGPILCVAVSRCRLRRRCEGLERPGSRWCVPGRRCGRRRRCRAPI